MLSKKNILFNPLKHHAGFARAFVSNIDLSALPMELKKVGNCQLDFYYGELGLDSIYREVVTHLSLLGIYTYEDYKTWIQNHKGFHALILTDQSKWITRLGADEERFVHIHPARYSPFTIRVVANKLKTAIVLRYFSKGRETDFDIEKFNDIRTSILELSPVKKLEDMKGVQRLMSLVFDTPNPEKENRIAYI